MKKIFLLALLAGTASFWAKAQKVNENNSFMGSVGDDSKISRTPINKNGGNDLFDAPKDEDAFYFRINLPKDEFLIITLNNLGYWSSKGPLQDIIGRAAQAANLYSDSFKNVSAAHTLQLHLSSGNGSTLLRSREWGANTNTFAIDDAGLAPLKVTTDTVQIMQMLETPDMHSKKKQHTTKRIYYTFLLKDARDLGIILANNTLLNSIDSQANMLVMKQLKRWRNPDGSAHTLAAEINAADQDVKVKTVEKGGQADKRFGAEFNIGASMLTNLTTPYFDYGLIYKWPSRQEGNLHFVKLTLSTILSSTTNNGSLISNGMEYANVEIGEAFATEHKWMAAYRTSIGFGYKFASDINTGNSMTYRIFFNYSVTKALTITPDYYIDKNKEKNKGQEIGGITVTLRIL